MPNRIPLIKGYQAFRATDFHHQKQLYDILGRKGQSPNIMLLSCADSRVDPTDIFHAYPGEMFVVRNVAATIPPHQTDDGFHGTASAIEYGVRALHVKSIVVMGHESCGGVAGCLNGLGDLKTDYVGNWVKVLEPAKAAIGDLPPEERQHAMELETVRLTLRNLMTYPFIAEAVEAGELQLIGSWFSIISAELKLMDESGEFLEVPTGEIVRPVEPDPAQSA